MTQLRQAGEQSLAKILDKGQVTRLKQIQLQLGGPWVVLREDMVEKLNLSEEQVESLTEIRDGQRQKSREVQKSGREAMQAAMAKIDPAFANFGGGRNAGGRGNGGNGGNGGGNAGNGGNGGNGNQGNRQRPDPEAFRKVMESPEVKAQMEAQRDQAKVIEDESYAIVMKNLYPRQRTTLKKMVGAPFDRSLMGNPFGRGPGGPRGQAATKNGAAPGKAAAVAKSGDDDEEAAPAATTKTPTAAKPKPSTTTTQKQSLRSLRGSSDD